MGFFSKIFREIKRVGDQLTEGGVIPAWMNRQQDRAQQEADRQFELQQEALNQQRNQGLLEAESITQVPNIVIGGTARRQRRRGNSMSSNLGV